MCGAIIVYNTCIQIAMQGFKMAGIDFVAAIPVLSNDLSKRENDCTIAYCEARGIKYELFPIDVPALFDGDEFEYYGEKSPTTQPQMTIAGKFFDLLIVVLFIWFYDAC